MKPSSEKESVFDDYLIYFKQSFRFVKGEQLSEIQIQHPSLFDCVRYRSS